MKLIIDIPEEIVTAIQNGQDYRYDIHTAIAQGKPYDASGNLISREALKDKCNEIMKYNPSTDRIMDLIDNAPTVERPQGKWIENLDSRNDEMQASCYCSECGASCYCATDKFCHECGADMRGKEE